MGLVSFSGLPTIILPLKQISGANIFIETGTNQAATSLWASDHFARVVTIEGYEPLYRAAVEKYGNRKNIEFKLGDSRSVLPEVIKSLDGPAIFWLDAHWCGTETFGVHAECPVEEELRAVNGSNFDHIILVDDARLFLEPPKPPHSADHWPGLGELVPLMDLPTRRRYVAVSHDALIAVPIAQRSQLIDFLRKLPEVKFHETPNPLSKRIVRKVKHAMGLK